MAMTGQEQTAAEIVENITNWQDWYDLETFAKGRRASLEDYKNINCKSCNEMYNSSHIQGELAYATLAEQALSDCKVLERCGTAFLNYRLGHAKRAAATMSEYLNDKDASAADRECWQDNLVDAQRTIARINAVLATRTEVKG